MRWNGTAINRDPDRPVSIEGTLRAYFIRFLVIGILLGAVIVSSVLFYVREGGRLMDAFYHLQAYYDTVDLLYIRTEEALSLGSHRTDGEDERLLRSVHEDLDYLASLRVKGNFLRNIDMQRKLLSGFQRLREEAFEGSQIGSEKLERLGTYAQAISRQKGVLTEELNRYYNRRRDTMAIGIRLLACLLSLTFLLGFLVLGEQTRLLSILIAAPLHTLTKQAQIIQTDDIAKVRMDVLRDREVPLEIETLSDAFARLLERISEQVTQLREAMQVKEALKEKELENLRVQHQLTLSELRCLQMQMNPHFLFNTLNMIQQNLYMDKKEKTMELLKETAAFLRYSLDYVGKNVTLEKELEGLGAYVTLLEERLGDRVFFEFILEERLGDWIVPCLILQPLVENSVIHGLGQMLSGGQVVIRTVLDADTGEGRISIEDNGAGIEPDKLLALRQSLCEDYIRSQERVGLHNVARRLQLTGRGQMLLDSIPGEGTTVTILLSGEGEKKEHDQVADC